VNPVDLLLVSLFALCAVRGYFRGLFREIMGLAGFAMGAVAAVVFSTRAAIELQRYADLGLAASEVSAAVLIFVIVNLLTHVVAAMLDRLARMMFLTGVTRLAGAFVGLSKGAVLVGFLLFLVRSLAPLPTVVQAIDHSRIGAPLADAAGNVFRAGTGALGPTERREA
jgi:membrane protein required for colicin V production